MRRSRAAEGALPAGGLIWRWGWVGGVELESAVEVVLGCLEADGCSVFDGGGEAASLLLGCLAAVGWESEEDPFDTDLRLHSGPCWHPLEFSHVRQQRSPNMPFQVSLVHPSVAH